MSWQIRYSAAARDDIKRLYDFLLQHDQAAAERALDSIIKSVEILSDFPYTARKADPTHPLLRELLIPFGGTGYVALFEIEDSDTLTILAVRHQREDDYH